MKKDELIKLALENEKLQKKLVELQREVSTVGRKCVFFGTAGMGGSPKPLPDGTA